MDSRAHLAAALHHSIGGMEHEANIRREERDKLIRELRTENPKYWSYARLARTIGCSKTRIKAILDQGLVV